MMFGLRDYVYAGVIAVLVGWGVWHGIDRYRAGVAATTAEFMKADREGAEDARKTAERVLRDLGGVDDPDQLLDATGGLRD